MPLCDVCGVHKATERHHIYTRYLTNSKPSGAEYANFHLVVSCLCRDCHEDIDTTENRENLLRFLYSLHGYAQVKAQDVLIRNQYKSGIGWQLPLPKGANLWRIRKRKTQRGRLFLTNSKR